jgi:hypothetical protein
VLRGSERSPTLLFPYVGKPQLGDGDHLGFERHSVCVKTEAQSGAAPPSPNATTAARITRAHKLRQQPVEAPAAWTGRGLFLWRSRHRQKFLSSVAMRCPSAMLTICSDMLVVTRLQTGATTRGRCKHTSVTRISNTPCDTLSYRRRGSRISDENECCAWLGIHEQDRTLFRLRRARWRTPSRWLRR